LLLSEIDPASSSLAEQEKWRKRLAAAELAYHEAGLALRTALQEEAQRPGDPAAVADARERKERARLEYLRVLRIFTDLVLRGKLPAKDKD
jgi:hypothetical protein